MAITPLPTPPSRADSTNFSARADAFLGALPTFAAEAEATRVEVNANATTASVAAADAVNAAAVSIWQSGVSVTAGGCRYSPTNFKTYRRKTTGSSTTDPKDDPTNWVLLSGQGDADLSSSQNFTNKAMGSGCSWAGTAIPVAYGGTGAATASAARTALGAVSNSDNETIGGDKTFSGALQQTNPTESQVRAIKTGINASTVYLFNSQTDVGVFDATYGSVIQKTKATGATTIGGVASKDFVAGEVAKLTLGAIGTSALMYYVPNATVAPGTSVSGSDLRYASAAGAYHSTVPAGTWLCMGAIMNTSTAPEKTTMWMRTA